MWCSRAVDWWLDRASHSNWRLSQVSRSPIGFPNHHKIFSSEIFRKTKVIVIVIVNCNERSVKTGPACYWPGLNWRCWWYRCQWHCRNTNPWRLMMFLVMSALIKCYQQQCPRQRGDLNHQLTSLQEKGRVHISSSRSTFHPESDLLQKNMPPISSKELSFLLHDMC